MSGLSLARTYQEARWGEDLDASGAETASDLESLEQDVLHILMETLGSNLADPDKGVGVANYLSGTSARLAALPAVIDAQLSKVARITSSHTTLSPNDDGTFAIAIAIQVATLITTLQYNVGPHGLTSTTPR